METSRKTATLTFLAISFLINACGGGGGGGTPSNNNPPPGQQQSDISEWQKGVYPPVEFLVNRCENPRTGADPQNGNAPFLDQAGSWAHEKMWLRSWSNDLYLWYNELPDLDPAPYSVGAYFNLLKTNDTTPSGKDKDEFHFSVNTQQWQEFINTGGTGAGYGMSLSVNNTFSRTITVSYVEPGSPAEQAGIKRGTRILSVDDIPATINTVEGIDALNQVLFPAAPGESYTFVLRHLDEDDSTSITLISEEISSDPVLHVQTFERDSATVGYMLFNNHIATAETRLKTAIQNLSDSGVDELILDLRYNGGGIVAVSSQLAYMIAGPEATFGETFELFEFNDKYPTKHPITGLPIEPTPFLNTTVGLSEPFGQALPSLDLARVFIISSEDTCSASEGLINGLRGIGIQVILIGGQTCGKPYGFYGQDNCGTSYFTIQFKGVNAEGYGDYADGFRPALRDNGLDQIEGCPLGDDLNHDFNEEEANIAAALHYMENGSCPTSSKNKHAHEQYKQLNKPLWQKIKVMR